MARDPSKSFGTSNAIISFFFVLFFLLIAIRSLLHLHVFKPFESSNNLLYNPILYFQNPITTSCNSNENCTDRNNDEALFQKANSIMKKKMASCDKKVAFMFMTKGRMPLMPLWERLFQGQNGKYFSIYVHVSSSELYEEPHESSVFHGRSIPSKPVEWGTPSMVDAERRLLANALLDPLNERFVLLSESCIPLFNFSTIYDYLMRSDLSFVGSFDEPNKRGRGRYNRAKMYPIISLDDWRKGSQWFEVHRELANVIISDRRYYALFAEYCRPPCYMDEHYIPTLITKLHPSLNSNRSLTWANWSRGGAHPAELTRKDVSAQLIEGIRTADQHCMYKLGSNSNSSVCFLFARKFDATSLQPLMHLSPLLLGY